MKISNLHHDQIRSIQVTCAKDIKSLVEVFEELGNPFEEDSGDLLALDSKDIMTDAAVKTVCDVVHIGQEQYDAYVNERLVERSKPTTDPIHRNQLPLMRCPRSKGNTNLKAQVATLNDDCALFSRLYIACQSRDGNLEAFFKHDNQAWPPSLSKAGKLRDGVKSDVLVCLEGLGYNPNGTPQVYAKILDGAVVVNMLPTNAVSTFHEYIDDTFIPYVKGQLHSVERIDLVWDVYLDNSLKESTREI